MSNLETSLFLLKIQTFIFYQSQEFDLGGYKWVKETKQPHKKLR